MRIKAIITGVTGMVGEGVLHECLNHQAVEQVLVINRKPCGITHPKLQEIIHSDFYNITPIKDKLVGYNACYFCLGTTSVGKKEDEYTRITHDLTLHVATILAAQNPEMIFCYVSGSHTDSTEKGKVMWARVKGKTENDLLQLPFKAAYMFRPGFMKPTKGLKNTLGLYKALPFLYPIWKLFAPNQVSTLAQVGEAMINIVLKGYPKKHIEVPDIKKLAAAV